MADVVSSVQRLQVLVISVPVAADFPTLPGSAADRQQRLRSMLLEFLKSFSTTKTKRTHQAICRLSDTKDAKKMEAEIQLPTLVVSHESHHVTFAFCECRCDLSVLPQVKPDAIVLAASTMDEFDSVLSWSAGAFPCAIALCRKWLFVVPTATTFVQTAIANIINRFQLQERPCFTDQEQCTNMTAQRVSVTDMFQTHYVDDVYHVDWNVVAREIIKKC